MHALNSSERTCCAVYTAGSGLKTKLRPLWNSNPWFDSSYCLLFDSPQTLLNLFSINSSLLLVTPDLSHGTVGFGRQAEECVEELVALAI